MKQEKEYFAFISYKSEDVEWATWLQHELEHYHLPASFNGRTDVPQELRPVFRDIDELSAGNLPEQIKKALANSQNLIVICSPQAAQSPWVNQEVETFIALGRTNRIFPFIVEGNSPSEFFPPALLNLPKDEERLGGDISKKGRDAAFVKVVAGMLGVGFDSLWNRYEKEKAEEERKQREQRDKLLIAQSRFLAEKASSLVEEGDAYAARLLALEALPKNIENPNRPYVIEAEAALRKSLYEDSAILRGHHKGVQSAILSHDGKIIATIGLDNCIKIWDANNGGLIKCIIGSDKTPPHLLVPTVNTPKDGMYEVPDISHISCSFSPDDKKIASSFADGFINIWDVEKGDLICSIKQLGYSVVFSPCGKYVAASTGTGYSIIIWESETGEIVKEIKFAHNKPIYKILFSNNWKFVISVGYADDCIKIWSVETCKIVKWIRSKYVYICAIDLDENDSKILIASRNSIEIGDLEKEVFEYHYEWDKSPIISASFISCNKDIAFGCLDGSLYILNTNNGICKEWLNYHNGKVYSVEYNIINGQIITSSEDKTAKITSFVKNSFISYKRFFHGAISPNQKYCVMWDNCYEFEICDSWGVNLTKNVLYSDLQFNFHTLFKLSTNEEISSIAFSTDGKLFATIPNVGKVITIWDSMSGKIINTIPHEEEITNATFCSHNQYLATTTTKVVELWNINDGSLLCINRIEDICVAITCLPNSTTILLGLINGKMSIWDIENNEIRSDVIHDGGISAIACTTDKEFVVTGSEDRTLKIWNTKDFSIYKVIENLSSGVFHIEISPDNTQLLLSLYDKKYMIYDINSGLLILSLKQKMDGIISPAYFCDNGYIMNVQERWSYLPIQKVIEQTKEIFNNRQFTPEERKQYYLD